MIFGHTANTEDALACMPEALKTALKYLRSSDFQSMPVGNYDLQGKDIYIQVFDLETKDEEDARPEVHRQYIDVQFSVEGKEIIGFARDTGNNKIAEDLLENKDVLFYEPVENENRLIMIPGSFAIFFPQDVHRPGIRNGEKSLYER